MTDAEFADWWLLLKKQLAPRTLVPNWTAASGYTSNSFEASPSPYINHEFIQIDGTQKAHIYQRLIHISDFKRVLHVWDDYQSGRIQRNVSDDLTDHSPYVLSIIHWLEETAK
jgi:hypothetical protein